MEMPPQRRRRSTAWIVLTAMLRALTSTFIISLVALGLFALRHDGLTVRELQGIAARYTTLWIMVFFGVLIWDLRFARRRDQRRD